MVGLDASLGTSLRTSSLLLGATLLAGCPDDPVTPVDTESSSTGASTTSITATLGGVCMPGEVVDCDCPGGTPGTRPCRADGMGYDACECGDMDTSSGTDPTAGDTTTTGDDSTTGPQPCTSDEDCAELRVAECEVPFCDASGTCVPNEAPSGTPCGDPVDGECSDPDACDGGCGEDSCTCTAGACGVQRVRAHQQLHHHALDRGLGAHG
jgi:hypothetical protein